MFALMENTFDPLDMDWDPTPISDPHSVSEVAERVQTVVRRRADQLRCDAKKALFLQTLAVTGNVTAASASAGWSRKCSYLHRKADKDFADLWDEALEVAIDLLETQARSLAVNGVDEPVFQNGVLVGHKRRYSEKMLEILLKAHRPEKYRDNMKIEADVKGGVLVVPGIASDTSWEAAAAAQQAQHRGNTGETE